jgi:hypothetical protein
LSPFKKAAACVAIMAAVPPVLNQTPKVMRRFEAASAQLEVLEMITAHNQKQQPP